MFSAYIIESTTTGRSYYGHTKDLDQRLSDHNSGRSHFTHGKGPWKPIAFSSHASRSEATEMERSLKNARNKMYALKLIGAQPG